MKQHHRLLARVSPCLLLGLLILMAGCREVALIPERTTTRSQSTFNRWDFCTGLDRFGISRRTDDFTPPSSDSILAGYITQWEPGAPPFPCHRFTQFNFQGLFSFNVGQLRTPTPERFRSAILELVEFRPANGGIRVTPEPTHTEFNTGTLTSTRRTCTFKVMRARQAWGTSREGDHITGIVDLASRPRNIVVSDTGSSRWQADVSREVGAWYREEERENGFVIMHADPEGFGAHKSNSCVGFFRFRLRTFLGEDR
jgi:hypothetical protein